MGEIEQVIDRLLALIKTQKSAQTPRPPSPIERDTNSGQFEGDEELTPKTDTSLPCR